MATGSSSTTNRPPTTWERPSSATLLATGAETEEKCNVDAGGGSGKVLVRSQTLYPAELWARVRRRLLTGIVVRRQAGTRVFARAPLISVIHHPRWTNARSPKQLLSGGPPVSHVTQRDPTTPGSRPRSAAPTRPPRRRTRRPVRRRA